MAPAGGIDVMLLLIGASGVVFGLLGLGLRRSVGPVTAFAVAGFLWSLAIIAVLTLLPTDPDVGIVPAEGRSTSCSMDYGGPAPDGFWVFAAGQRLLNTVLFVPAGALLVLAASRWRIGWVVVPLGLVGLAAYSVAIELIQLELARIDRACDVTDVVDNVSGAGIGVVVGLVLVLVFRPWRHRR
ncbi:VanZ family protein [Nocardioides islandensis]|uniref:VanZ family protein n=1 Tax=Nocardioides islandensis TaxID=433663 RepID=A0A930YCL7_9ACTN|nr:VanZ family protein [Nocardioides islandensis]MBF4761833.1 VanZ family protein [Nocardioides islandensis]